MKDMGRKENGYIYKYPNPKINRLKIDIYCQ